MKMKYTAMLLTGIAFSYMAVTSCKQQQPELIKIAQPAVSSGGTFKMSGNVREISMAPDAVVSLPEGEGKNELVSYCAMCHSLAYVTQQPDFNRQTWDEIVHKMVIRYNAPIDSATCNKIVGYLVKIKGAE